MQFVKPRYRRVMQFPVTVKVPLNIVIETGCERVIRILGPNQALPAQVVEWMANSPTSPHRDTVDAADDDSVPAGQRTVDSTATVVPSTGSGAAADTAQIVFNESNGLGVGLSAAPVADNAAGEQAPFGLDEAAMENIAETGAKLYETLKTAQAKQAKESPKQPATKAPTKASGKKAR